ncbi:hypothetical protein AM571_PA00282 (plasmid) [Rhizobium etli 8C-3]|uniref:Uncharacterized protein n=2 Tax=Rhizobium etli TaxID=29449 RepID=A0A1L5PAG4_RHIET|nr:hypothetical protein AM571_PA00282 [Rhizobium etli 8C-3]
MGSKAVQSAIHYTLIHWQIRVFSPAHLIASPIMPVIPINEGKYKAALAELGVDGLWIETMPPSLAKAFAAATYLFLMADYHRPLREEDKPLYRRSRSYYPIQNVPNFSMVFVEACDIVGTPLNIVDADAPPIIGCHEMPTNWFEEGKPITGNNRTTKEKWEEEWKNRGFTNGSTEHLVVLLCFEGIDTALINSVKAMQGVVIVVQDEAGKPNDPLIDPGNYDLLVTSERLPENLLSLMTLRYWYHQWWPAYVTDNKGAITD